MKPRSKALSLTLVATLAVAIAAAGASANSIAVDDGSFRLRWSEFTFVLSGIEGVQVRCPTTMEGRFVSSTFAKRSGATIASVAVAFGSCTGGSVTVLGATPWQVAYASFSGTLPAITGVTVHLVGGNVQIFALGTSCLGTSTGVEPLVGTFGISSGRSTQFSLGRGRIDLNDVTGVFCDLAEVEGEGEGTAAVEDRAGGPLGFSLV